MLCKYNICFANIIYALEIVKLNALQIFSSFSFLLSLRLLYFFFSHFLPNFYFVQIGITIFNHFKESLRLTIYRGSILNGNIQIYETPFNFYQLYFILFTQNHLSSLLLSSTLLSSPLSSLLSSTLLYFTLFSSLISSLLLSFTLLFSPLLSRLFYSTLLHSLLLSYLLSSTHEKLLLPPPSDKIGHRQIWSKSYHCR